MQTTKKALGNRFTRKALAETAPHFTGQPQCALIDHIYETEKHLHKEMEIAFVISGQADILAADHLFTVCAGELVCIRGCVPHKYMQKNQDTQVVKIKWMKEWMCPPFYTNRQKDACRNLYSHVFKTKPNQMVQDLILSMLDCPLPMHRECYCYGKLLELTALLLSTPEIIAETLPESFESLRYIESAIEYMQDNCQSKLTLKMLADHLDLTESYCSKYIKKSTGVTFMEFLTAMRVNNAQRLLIYYDYPITEIMQCTGFLSMQTFNRVFKQQTGQSPSDYRKSKRLAVTGI